MRTLHASWRRRVVVAIVALAFGWTVPGAEAARPRQARKISARASEQGSANPYSYVDVLVRFHRKPGALARSVLVGFGAQVGQSYRGRWMAAKVHGRFLKKLARDP